MDAALRGEARETPLERGPRRAVADEREPRAGHAPRGSPRSLRGSSPPRAARRRAGAGRRAAAGEPHAHPSERRCGWNSSASTPPRQIPKPARRRAPASSSRVKRDGQRLTCAAPCTRRISGQIALLGEAEPVAVQVAREVGVVGGDDRERERARGRDAQTPSTAGPTAWTTSGRNQASEAATRASGSATRTAG